MEACVGEVVLLATCNCKTHTLTMLNKIDRAMKKHDQRAATNKPNQRAGRFDAIMILWYPCVSYLVLRTTRTTRIRCGSIGYMIILSHPNSDFDIYCVCAISRHSIPFIYVV